MTPYTLTRHGTIRTHYVLRYPLPDPHLDGLASAIAHAGKRLDGSWLLSPARARKFEALYAAGFERAQLHAKAPYFRRYGVGPARRLPEALAIAQAFEEGKLAAGTPVIAPNNIAILNPT